MKKIDGFIELKDTYLKELPVNIRIGLLSEIENLRSIQTGWGTENNEGLRMYLNQKSRCLC